MPTAHKLPSLREITRGNAIFHDEMPVWEGYFGDDIWPFANSNSPLFKGTATSSIVWSDFLPKNKSNTTQRPSRGRERYQRCLTPCIIRELKIAAVIHGNFAKLIFLSRANKNQLAPETVRGRVMDLSIIISKVIHEAERRLNLKITSLSDIPLQLLKEVVATHQGRPEHVKRALLLIADPIVQRNLSAPLQWGIPDIRAASFAWGESPPTEAIPTLSDAQFLFMLEHCKNAISRFKSSAGMPIHDSGCRAFAESTINMRGDDGLARAIQEFYEITEERKRHYFPMTYGFSNSFIKEIIYDAHIASLIVALLFTAMRWSDTAYLMRNSLFYEHGFWFLRSKKVKRRPKDEPISEGWLAIDLTRDAYDILMYVTEGTGSRYLFSSAYKGYAEKTQISYRCGVLDRKIANWLKRFDEEGLFLNWSFSVHQCRETLVAQLAKQEVGLPFISMQLKHFHSQFHSMPNGVTAGYGQFRQAVIKSVTARVAIAREDALIDLYGEDARFAGGGGPAHKARIDTFFSGLGLFGRDRERYIKSLALRGVKLMPTSIGHCGKNFLVPTADAGPPCYGDYQCDPDCEHHVITAGSASALAMRKEHALSQAALEPSAEFKVVWFGLAEKLDKHIAALRPENHLD